MPPSALLVLLAFLAFVSLGLPDGLLGPSWPSMRGGFGLPLDALGALVVAATAGYLTSSFLSGAILRRLPLGTVLALSTAAAATALAGIALAPAWPLVLACGVLAGLGGGAIDAGLNAYGATHFSRRTLNWMHAFFGLGAATGPLVVTAVLASGLSWRWSYGLVATAQALLALTFLLTRWRWDRDAGGALPTPPAPALGTLRRPAVWLGMAVFFVYTGVELAAAQWSYSLLVLGRGVPEATAGLAVALYWGGLTAGRVAFGLVADRVPPTATLRVCLAGVVVGTLLFWLEPTPAIALAGLAAMGVMLAPVFATLIGLTPARVGAAHADSAIGFQIAAAGLGGAALTAGVGALAGALGLEAIGAALVVLALLLVALHEALARTGAASELAAPGT